jgi:inhibitor of cysteine peptidase
VKIPLICLYAVLSLAWPLSAQESTPTNAAAGGQFSVTLASNPTTGYKWDLAMPLDSNFLALVTNIYVRPNSQLMGAGGNEVWTFKALKQGTTRIDFKYVRPWEQNVPPARVTNVVVVIAGPKPVNKSGDATDWNVASGCFGRRRPTGGPTFARKLRRGMPASPRFVRNAPFTSPPAARNGIWAQGVNRSGLGVG